MCDVCQKTQGLPLAEALKLVGDEMKKHPAAAMHLTDLLDKLLPTEENENEDPELALAWELSHRRQED